MTIIDSFCNEMNGWREGVSSLDYQGCLHTIPRFFNKQIGNLLTIFALTVHPLLLTDPFQPYLHHLTELQVPASSRSRTPRYPTQWCPSTRVCVAGTDNVFSTHYCSTRNKQSQSATPREASPLSATFSSTNSYSPRHPKK